MSNPKCFIEDICGLRIGDMECLDIIKTEEGLEPQDETQKVEKLKESHLLLKKKLSLSHELIKQYNDKIKECQEVSAELEICKDKVRRLTQKNSSSVSKIVQLEFENEERRKKIEEFSITISDQSTKIAADQQHLQQLICKVNDLEHKASLPGKTNKREESLREKLKLLEVELKAEKERHKSEIKEYEIKLKSMKTSDAVKGQTKKQNIKMGCDKSTCTDAELKPATREKCIMTNEFYSIKDDPYPLFCAKCLIKLDPVPLDQILTQMSTCPKLITEVSSPLSKTGMSRSERSESPQIARAADDPDNSTDRFNTIERKSDVSKSDFQRLERKLSLLERKLRKKTKREDQLRNPCCGFPYPNNCYLGPYPSMFQPGAMIRSQADLLQFQNWQRGLKSRKRSRKSSFQKTHQNGIESRKKRRLEDGTSEWNVVSLQSKEFNESKHSNVSDNEFVPWNGPLRSKSPSLSFSKSKNKPTKCSNENKSSSRWTKQEKLDILFSPAHNSSYMEDQIDNERQNRSFDEEMIENDNGSPEHEIVECVTKKRGRGATKQTKTSAKNSLVKKIRNLKKNSNKSQTLPTKIVSAINDTRQLDQILGTKNVITALGNNSNHSEPIKTHEILNNVGDYCPGKKHRIAHSARKTENGCPRVGNKNCEGVAKTDFASNDVNDDKIQTTQNATAALTDEVDQIKSIMNMEKPKSPATEIAKDFAQTYSAHLVNKNENEEIATEALTDEFDEIKSITNMEKPKSPVTEIAKDFAQTYSAQLVNKNENEEIATEALTDKFDEIKSITNMEKPKSPVTEIAKDFTHTYSMQLVNKNEIEEIAGIAADETVTENKITDDLQISHSVVTHPLNNGAKKVIPPLQPCIIIPRAYLDIEGVEDPEASDTIENNESMTNIGLNNEKTSGETSLRILRSQSKKDEIDKSSMCNNSTAISHTTKIESFRYPDYIQQEESLDNELSESLSDINDASVSVQSDECVKENTAVIEVEKTGTRKYNKRIKIETAAVPDSPIRELRSRRIMLSPSENMETKNLVKVEIEEWNKESMQLPGNTESQVNNGFGPRALIEKYFATRADSKKNRRFYKNRKNEKLQQRKENLVLKELSKLADDEEWTKSVLVDAIERLSKFKTHTIAKCTIDFLVSRAGDDEELDRSYTPPAPLLSKTQQRIIAMLVTLNCTIPNIIQLVQAGIEYTLFRLGHAPDANIIQELTRVFTALARIQKDRERVRILCCDAMYCLNLRAMPLIYVILTSWPEVFPMAGTNNDPLIRCLINSIMTQTGNASYCKFFALKKLLTGYYSYESDGFDGDTLLQDFITTLGEKRVNGLDTAIILFAKKKGTEWTHKNIIQGSLLPMIVCKAHPSVYDAFCLLGYIMRSFPIDDKKGSIKNIIEQLCALIESGEGSMQQQEGVATALISLYRHKPDIVAKTILSWNPSEPLSESMSRQLNILFNFHPPIWWKRLMLKNSIKS